MDEPVATPGSPATPQQQPGIETILTLVTGVLAGVGGVYVGTRSVPITIIAAVAAVALTAMVLFVRK